MTDVPFGPPSSPLYCGQIEVPSDTTSANQAVLPGRPPTDQYPHQWKWQSVTDILREKEPERSAAAYRDFFEAEQRRNADSKDQS
jgi:hypothetical protein